MYRRPHPTTLERTSSPSSSSSSSRSRAHQRQRRILSSLRIFVIHAKIVAEEVERLYRLAESLGADINSSIDQADVIITSIAVLKRLERHIDMDHAVRHLTMFSSRRARLSRMDYLQREKKVVTPLWLKDSASREELMPFEPYFAVHSLRPSDNVRIAGSPSAPVAAVPPSPGPSVSRPLDFQSTISYKARFATHRLSPLKCPNQGLVDNLAIIMRWRFLEGDARSELSYARSIAVSSLRILN